MAKVKIEASAEAIKEAGQDSGDFVLPPKGLYVARLESITKGFKKKDDGSEDKSQPNLKCEWKLVGEGRAKDDLKGNYGHIWDYVTFGENAEWKRAEFLLALGHKKGASIEIEAGKPGTVIGTEVLMRVKHETQPGYETSAKVGKLLALTTDSEDEDAFAEDEDETTEDVPTEELEEDGDDEADPFADEEEAPAEEEAEEESGYSQEDLEALAPKELVPIAAEFDINAKDFKGKTAVADLIAAILEAQEDPF